MIYNQKVRGKYIYGIINPAPGSWCGINPNTNTPASMNRCGGEDVYIIPFQDISAAVSDSEMVDYNYMPRDVLAKFLLKHQKVTEEIMSEHTIIPMRLGTFAKDENEVADILKRGYEAIKNIFEKINNKIEIDVAATWGDFSSVIKEVGEEKEIKEFKEGLLANPKGITADEQMKVGLMVKKALDERRRKCALEIQTFLKSIVNDIKIHGLMDDKMILNSAFLIDKDKQADFYKKIEELDVRFSKKLNFRCIGPLPPYSFYTLLVKKMQFEEIDWARKKLGLSNFINKNEVNKTYRNLALLEHPDINLDTPDVEKKFGELNKAYKILLDYCMALEQAGQGDKSSLGGEKIKNNTILVKVGE